jgi:type IV pilus assembly protein PilM
MLTNPLANAFGLDIGDRSLKLVQVKRQGRRPPRITAWGSVDLPEGSMDRGEIMNPDQCVEGLKRLLKDAHGHLRGRAAVACLPEVKSFIKIIDLPASANDEAITSAVKIELEQNIPLPTDEIYYDWQKLDEPAVAVVPKTAPSPKDKGEESNGSDAPAPPKDGEKGAPQPEAPAERQPATIRLALAAAPKKIIDAYAAMMEGAGIIPVALEIEAAAIARALIPQDQSVGDAVGLLDIGATRSALIIYDAGAIQMSISIPISGVAITKLIADSLKVGLDDAETLKRECGLDVNRCEDKMWRILYPLIDDISEKIRNALRFYKIGFPGGKKIETLYLCGGGAHFREIDTVLSRKLAVKVIRGNPLANVGAKLPRSFPQEMTLNYSTGIGLALRAAEETGAR